MSVAVHGELDHRCEECGGVSAATVMGVGLDEHSAQVDAASLIRLARCPHCTARNPGVRRAQRMSVAAVALVLLALVLFAAGSDMDLDLLKGLLAGPLGIGDDTRGGNRPRHRETKSAG